MAYRCRVDEQWTSEYVSEGCFELTGYDASDITETRRVTWDKIIYPEDREIVRAELRRLIAASEQHDNTPFHTSYRIVTAQGELKYVRDRSRPLCDARNKTIALEGIITDITDITLADEHLRDSEARYRLLAENMRDLVCLHDLNGRYIYVSPSCEQVLGFHPHELIGTDPYQLFHPEDALRIRDAAHVRLLRGESGFTIEYRMRRSSGDYVWLETMWQTVLDERGAIAQLQTCSRDITERKSAEEERSALLLREQEARREAEKANLAKDDFLALVSHEFRTPLTTIKTLVRVMQADNGSSIEWREYLETIAVECDRQIDMVLNLLDVSRIEKGAVDLTHAKVNVCEVLRSCDKIERHAARSRHQDLKTEIPQEPLLILGDAKALRRALCTITENAIKYTPEGGAIKLSAARRVRQRATDNDEITISVMDNGRGIRSEDLPHIFEKFYRGRSPATARAKTKDQMPDDSHRRAEAPGVGLGLYLARRIIESLGGCIEVESAPLRGTCFTIKLPAYEESEESKDEDDGDAR
jgi:PAS domain S-box-containing protein